MSICDITIIKDFLAIIVSALTLILAFFGLSTWRRKLWGENKFTLATACLKELLLVKEEIKVFRNGFYSAGEIYFAIKEYKEKNPNEVIKDENTSIFAENRRWNNLIDRYNSYIAELVKLKVVLNNYNLDIIENNTMETFIRELNINRIQSQLSKDERFNLSNYTQEQREDYSRRQEKIFSVLVRTGKEDVFEKQIEDYFFLFNKRVRKYIPQ